MFSFVMIAAATAVAQDPTRAQAQEAAVIEQQDTRVRFENDGTGVREMTLKVRVQSEAGVQRFGQLVEGYSSATETLDVDYVRVRKPNGQVIDTPKEAAQDFAPEILIAAPMYSDYRQRHITVTALRPGDVLESHMIWRTTTPLAAGEFWFDYTFPKWVALKLAKLEVDVPKDRAITLKSPKRKYTTEENGGRRVYTWVVEDIKPDRKALHAAMEDEGDAEDEQDASAEIQLTTFRDWQQVGRWYAKLQGERVIVDDTVLAKAAELTKGATTSLEKTRRLYDYVARNFRYVSLSFGVGRLQPHSAPEILRGGYGDCKDKHTLLAALLRAANITSYPVLIDSSRKLDEDVPSPGQFDHVITAVVVGNDLTWMDTTAEIAPFGLLTYGLRNKQALLAASDARAGLTRTPSAVPVKNTMTYTMDGKVSETGTLDAVIELIATGDSDLPLRSSLRQVSQADWERMAEAMSQTNGASAKVSELEVGSLEDTTKPLRIKYRFRLEKYFRVPSADAAYLPFLPLGFPRLQTKAKGKQPLNIGPAVEITQRTRLQFPANFTLRLPSEVSLSRDYAEFKSIYRLTGNLLQAERRLVIKANELPASRGPDVESLRSVLHNLAAQTISCTIRPASQADLAAAVPAGSSPDELRKAAARAAEQRDFQTASDLLKQVVEKEPSSKSSWDDLGRAYVGLSDHVNAAKAFQRQIEINPYHKSAYKELGDELAEQGRYEEAVAAYHKQVENVPLDVSARKNLGLLLLQLKRNADAIEQLDAAAALPPEDAETKMALALAYSRAGKMDKARPLLTTIVGNVQEYPSDLFAAALRDDADPDAAERDARKLLDDIGDQFDSGAFSTNPPEAFSAMHYVALAWARLGWARCQKGARLECLRYLEASWDLSQSPVIAERIARASETAGQTALTRRWLGLAVAAGSEAARDKLLKLDAMGGEKQIQSAKAELAGLRAVKLPTSAGRAGVAEFNLVFDGSSKPERAEFWSGATGLRSFTDTIVNASYPVMFPDVSSVKIVRRGVVSCAASGCTVTLKDIGAVQPAVRSTPDAALQKAEAAPQK
ncbi:MAG: DUF3857 domain-containing protein [Terriglobales bacterium]